METMDILCSSFEVTVSKLSENPEIAIFVGDDFETDILEPKKLGIKTIFSCKETNNYEMSDAIIGSLISNEMSLRGMQNQNLDCII